jgi:excisionase family DNA binding protein
MSNCTPAQSGNARPSVAATKPSVSPVVLTVNEAAASLRMARSSIYKMIAARRLRTVKFGRSRRIPVAEVQRLAANAR